MPLGRLPRVAVAPGAWRYAAPLFALGFLLPVAPLLAVAGLAGGVAVLWFHRDPSRTPPEDGFVSPADGRVSVLRTEGDRVRVGVFLNVTDVHVCRAPSDGVVEGVDHRAGAHRPAFSKDSERNERVDIDCGSYEVSLVAGAFARRIHPYVEPGERLRRGERVGHVSFGSRADVLLPPGIDREDVRVCKGDRVRAGETVIAPVPASKPF
ncbi:protein sorting system archaetidylserine decarboxylase [Halalkaliarchaeum sp. AArc-GB]|uniref:protein sorting system archaetidylserine decarboxylase n=1 Tax=Halalkaliarchaeum sp. AArc-GB TaxID=3074078 RepID=UPI002856B92E|nr:protein sorting system archaetidylserine decarboxylase [Halalkaliarchaeum sp. AArc-GB]MDR5673322.1 protein sorting system archaetidylserine decarboxylase [Halalkaliarchaeum sp. AArc-GB]